MPCELLDEWPDAPGSWPVPVEAEFDARLRAYRAKHKSFEVAIPATAGLDGVSLGSVPRVEALDVDKQAKPKPPPRRPRQKAATP